MRKITFQPQFETALLTETKQQTCRKREKYANVKVGDTVILTIAGGEDIAEAEVVDKQDLENCLKYLPLGNSMPKHTGEDPYDFYERIYEICKDEFAQADGFKNFTEFEMFLDKQYGKGMYDIADFDVLYFKITNVLPKKQSELW